MEEIEGGEVIDVPLQVSRPLDGGGDIGLAGDPSDQSFSGGIVAIGLGGAVATEGGGETASGAGDGVETFLHELVGGGEQSVWIVGIYFAAAEGVFFERIEPSIDDAPKRSRGTGGGGDALGQSSIDGF